MFIGVDHGTTAMRFASNGTGNAQVIRLEVPRQDIAVMSETQVISLIEENFGVKSNEIKMIAVTYSMGDSITSIENIRHVQNRGVRSLEGAGKKTGGGSRVFDAIRNSGITAVVIPGIHDKSLTDPRLNVFSHSTSPEKIGIAYHAFCMGFDNFVLSDISSNTVTLGVAGGKVIGAIDACIFAPGLIHGPLDVQALRDVDAGRITANDAFTRAGVLRHTPFSDRHELLKAALKGDSEALLALDTIALFAAMEVSCMQILLKDYGAVGEVVLEGSVGEVPRVVEKINAHLGIKCHVLDRWSAAIGCAEIARDIAGGSDNILGIPVNF
ncbi:MAG: methanogenesis marker 12 protein [Methanolobus sp.]|uniref:methanogenesis marker 12 protein n=1 Tax=Methanolobus sp. TaxID=1874737 RepID=UPI00272F1C5F|nr:methanogenesis marker 12 protein [Methanolobus sp.]MDP2218476.1 methanogenesis marker 12 protein [Methanolobus sp.]